MTLEERIANARYSVFVTHPYLGYILQHIPLIERDDIETAATEGLNIFYNKMFMQELSEDALKFIILHELLHIILAHPSRGIGMEQQRFNVACDIVVNDILIKYGFSYAELTPIIGENYNLKGHRSTAESIYDKLKKHIIEHKINSHQFWRELSSDEKRKIFDIFQKTKNEFGEFFSEHLLKESYFFQDKPRKNWKRIFDNMLIAELSDYSFRKIDTRFDDILLPTYIPTIETLKDIWVVIDVSGSMKDELNDVMDECRHIVKEFPLLDIKISFFSNIVTTPNHVTKIKDFETSIQRIRTTGGTSFSIIFEKLDEFFPYKKPKSILIMTDGHAIYPDANLAKGIPVIWLITDQLEKPTFGKTYYLS